MNNDHDKIDFNIVKHLEDLSSKVNKMMAQRTQSVLERYPILFGLLILVGVTAIHEGLKGLMKKLGILEIDPLYLLVVGLGVLTITGTLYKKLDK
jgi:hypothetical protein